MNKFLLLLLLSAIDLNAQETEMKFYNFNLTQIVQIPEDVYDEAEKLNIERDQVFINFTINPDCTMENFKITKEGKLKSLTNFIQKKSKSIIDAWLKKYPCENIKTKSVFSFPITLSFN